MRLAHIIEARQQQSQRIDPRQILASEILAWTTPELEAAVEREIEQNPALETHEIGAVTSQAIADAPPEENTAQAALPSLMLSSENSSAAPLNSLTSGSNAVWNGSLYNEDDGVDPFDRVASHLTLRDHLRGQVGQVTDDPHLAKLTRCLIECVDERGYLLTGDIEDVAESLQVTIFEVEASVRALQKMDPPGVGARSLHECLLLQSDYLEQAGEGHALARRILQECWENLPTRHEQRMASRLRATTADVRAALRFIQTNFTPYPGSAFRPEGLLPRGNTGSAAVRPDLIFHRSEVGFTIELTRDYEASLSVAPLWQRLAEKPDTGADEAMRRYIRDHVERAQRFLSGVSRRGQTLRRIAALLTELQAGYLETGNRAFLRPLTRQTLAENLGLDESVVSRAVSDKWVQLPGGEVVALDAFFGNSHAIRDALAALVAAENPGSPYSDDEIADILSAQGFPLARRTVAKYRSLEKILPARLRRRSLAA